MKKCMMIIVFIIIFIMRPFYINADLDKTRHFEKPNWQCASEDDISKNKLFENLKQLKIKEAQEKEKLRQEEIKKYEELIRQQGQQFKATFYTLSYASCEKNPGDYWYGKTCTGFDLRGLDWQSARVIAVDPNVIPLHSRVELVFTNPNLSHMNGIYQAQDVGGAIRGNHIDFYLDEYNESLANNYGYQNCWIKIIN